MSDEQMTNGLARCEMLIGRCIGGMFSFHRRMDGRCGGKKVALENWKVERDGWLGAVWSGSKCFSSSGERFRSLGDLVLELFHCRSVSLQRPVPAAVRCA